MACVRSLAWRLGLGLFFLMLVLVAALLGALLPRARGGGGGPSDDGVGSAVPPAGSPSDYLLLDTFDLGRPLNTSLWRFDLGDGSDYGIPGWGNNELECYTASADNVAAGAPDPDNPATNGVLRIRALPRPAGSPPCVNAVAPPTSSPSWTSAKLTTKGSAAFAPRLLPAGDAAGGGSGGPAAACEPVIVEARARVPMQRGKWAAFWMMPEPQLDAPVAGCPTSSAAAASRAATAATTIVECGAYGPWPRSGEIDIMEHVDTSGAYFGTLHYALAGAGGGQHAHVGGETAPAALATGAGGGEAAGGGGGGSGWATYGVEWGCDRVRFAVDGVVWRSVTRGDLAAAGAAAWPFDQPFFLIVNLAVGGNLVAGPVDAAAGELLLDWVGVRPGPRYSL